MVIIRPITLDDLPSVLALTELTGFGLTTLPRDAKLLRRRIRDSLHGFEKLADADPPGGETYLFVLEDLDNGKVVGTCGIVSKVGGFEPFYAYGLETSIHESRQLNVRKEVRTLHLIEQHDGPCEVGSLFLTPDYRKDGNGRLLSLARFLFMADYREYFDPVVIAEMRGVVDDQGNSPFWEAVGKHFFEIDFPSADYLSMVNKKFIADLMPRHPIYITLLPPGAQSVIGDVHEQTRPALKLLEDEGFRKCGMVDIFEAGPVVRCRLEEIRSIARSTRAPIEEIAEQSHGTSMIIANGRQDFRACRAMVDITPSGGVRLDRAAAAALLVKAGEDVRFVSPRPTATGGFNDAPALFSGGAWETGSGPAFRSVNPATGQAVWEGSAVDSAQIDRAVAAARSAAASWSNTSVEQRTGFLNAFAEQLRKRRGELAEAISMETGKPRWETLTEVDSMINKVPVSIQAFSERRRPVVVESPTGTSATRFKPHGVVAVFGPFNFPGHLPNGHIVPALLAGNTVVFKPSELAPLVAEKTIECWKEAGVPSGVINLVQGGREVGQALLAHPGLDGIFFTGSAGVGKAMRRALADHPEKILALEMGGNNPLIVHEVADVKAAVYHTIQSAYLTSGQRCSCARRLIVPKGKSGDEFIEALANAIPRIRVGSSTDEPEPFMGPVINDAAAEKLLGGQARLIQQGGRTLVEMKTIGPRAAFLLPGLIDVTAISNRPDEEYFGPLLQLIRVADFDAAITEANRTSFGLSAGLLSDKRDLYDKFFSAIRAGVVNWNRALTGASASLPFGGVGQSGNHRPSAYFAADYCSYPVASMEGSKLELPAKLAPGIAL